MWVGGHRPFLAVPSFFHFDILQNSKALVSKKCLFLGGHGFKSQEVHDFLVMGSNPPWDKGWNFFQPIHIITKCSIGSKPPHNRKKHNLTSWKHGGHGYLPQRCGVCVRVYIQQRDCVEMFCASVEGVGGSVKGALRLWWNCVGSSHTARLAGGNSPECKRSMRGAPRVERNRKGSHQSA